MAKNMSITVDSNDLRAEANTGNKQWVAVITGTHPQYDYEREFVCYQQPKTSRRYSGSATVEDGTVIEYIRYTHSGKNRSKTYYQVFGDELHEIEENDIEAALEEIVVEINEQDETAADQMNSGQQAVTDGGVEYDEYDINPMELEFDMDYSLHNSTNSLTTTLAQIKDSDLWICFTSWATPGNGTGYLIKGIGHLSVDAIELDHEFMVEQIHDRVDGEIGPGVSDCAQDLKTQAPELVERVIEEWEFATEEIILESIYEVGAPLYETLVWMSHVPDAYVYEIKYAVEDVNLESTPDEVARDIVRDALFATVSKKCTGWQNPHAEYIGRLKFEVEPSELRELEEMSNRQNSKHSKNIIRPD